MRNNCFQDIGKMVQDGTRATPSFQLDTSIKDMEIIGMLLLLNKVVLFESHK